MIFSFQDYKDSIKDKLILANWDVKSETEFTFSITKKDDINTIIYIDILSKPFEEVSKRNVLGTKYENDNIDFIYIFAPDAIYQLSLGHLTFNLILNLDIFKTEKSQFDDEEIRYRTYESILINKWCTANDLLKNYNKLSLNPRINKNHINIDLLNILAERTRPKIELKSRNGQSGDAEYIYKYTNIKYFDDDFNTSDFIHELNKGLNNEKIVNEILLFNQTDQNELVNYCCAIIAKSNLGNNKQLKIQNHIIEFIDKYQENLEDFIHHILIKISPKKIPHKNLSELSNKTIINPSIDLLDALNKIKHDNYNISYHIINNDILKERVDFYKIIQRDFNLFEIEFNNIAKIILSNNRNKETIVPKFRELELDEFETYSIIEKTEEELIDFKRYFGNANDWSTISFNNRFNCIKYIKSSIEFNDTEDEKHQIELKTKIVSFIDLISEKQLTTNINFKSGQGLLKLDHYIFQELDENNFLSTSKIKKYLLNTNENYEQISNSAIIISNDYSKVLYLKKSDEYIYIEPNKFKVIQFITTSEYNDEFIFEFFMENIFNILLIEKPIKIESKYLDIEIKEDQPKHEIDINIIAKYIPNSIEEVYNSLENILNNDKDFDNIIIKINPPHKYIDLKTKQLISKEDEEGIYTTKYIFKKRVHKLITTFISNEEYYILSEKNKNKIQGYLDLFIDLLKKNEENFYKRLKLEFSHRYKNKFIELEQQITSITESNNKSLIESLKNNYWQNDPEERKIWLKNNPFRKEELLTASNLLNHSKDIIINQRKNLEKINELYTKFSSGNIKKHSINQFIEDICSKNKFTNVKLNLNNTKDKSIETNTEIVEACFENFIDNGTKYGNDFTITTELNDNIAFIHFENVVTTINIDIDTYNGLGNKTIQDQKTSKVHLGLKLSFEFLRKNMIEVEKIDYKEYVEKNIFKITCKVILL